MTQIVRIYADFFDFYFFIRDNLYNPYDPCSILTSLC